MKIIGITGPIGCGKSYVAQLIEKQGIPTVDADQVYHQLTSVPSPLVAELSKEFGECILTSNGALDRQKLAPIVFKDPDELEKLNAITHKAILAEIKRHLDEYKNTGIKAVTLQVPLMFESGADKLCDAVLCVAASEEKRIERICQRDGISKKDAQNRIKNQKEIQFYIANSSETVYNDDTVDLIEQINNFLAKNGLV